MRKFIVLLLVLATLIIPQKSYSAATVYYLTQETSLYKDLDSMESYGQIRKGDDVTIEEDHGDFVKITYAGCTGYVAKKNLSEEVVYVLSEKEEGKKTYVTAYEEPEFLLPINHYVSSLNEESEFAILNYAATPDMEDDYVIIEDFDSILINEQLITSAYTNGCENITLNVLNKDTNKTLLSLSIETYETTDDEDIDFGFSIKDNGIKFNSRKLPTKVTVGIHNNYNVTASQDGNRLNSTTENYSTYFELENLSEITFSGVSLDDVKKDTTSSEKEEHLLQNGDKTDDKASQNETLSYLIVFFLLLAGITVIFTRYMNAKEKEVGQKRHGKR